MAFKFLNFVNIKGIQKNHYLYRYEKMKAGSGHYMVLFAFLASVLTSCSVGNKDIPTPGGNSNVDTTSAALNTFNMIVSGDTSFIMTITSIDSLNTLQDDSLLISGFEFSGTSVVGIFGFKTYASNPDTYITEGSPPGIKTADFGILKTIRGVRKIYDMNHGTITITEHDVTAKTVKGKFDVNNEFNVTANIFLRCRGNFYIKYQ
ncbi:MAG: hypothetical protein U0X41_12170 [Chitinophagales bacterium]